MRICRLHLPPQRSTEPLIARKIRSWREFNGTKLHHRFGGHELSLFSDGQDHDFEVGLVGQGAPVNQGGGQRVGGVGEDGSSAEGFD